MVKADNYLLRNTAGVPKTRIYRAIRKGEVRVNKGRSKVDYRVQATDVVRVPPLSVGESPPQGSLQALGKRCERFCSIIQTCWSSISRRGWQCMAVAASSSVNRVTQSDVSESDTLSWCIARPRYIDWCL